MQNSLRKIYRNAQSATFIFLYLFAAVHASFAVGASIKVQQTVVKEGMGSIGLPVDATPPKIFNVRIYNVGLHSAQISFETNEVCTSEIYYSRDKTYASGPLADHPESYEAFHKYSLEDLEPGMKYYLKIKVENQKGVENVTTAYYFYTVPEFKALPNVGSLSAAQTGEEVFLSWKNPQGDDLRVIQINRQKDSPALSPENGEKIFTGFAENFTDVNVVDATKYYYTIFTFDKDNNFSSGAVVSVKTAFSHAGTEEDGTAENGNEEREGDGEEENPVLPNGSGQSSAETETNAVVEDVRNLNATAKVGENEIVLQWDCPETEKVCEVEVRRNRNFPSMSPVEGEKIYGGSGTSFVDKDVESGLIYFYTVYAKNKDGIYSSGKLIAGSLDKKTDGEIAALNEWKDMSFSDAESGVSLFRENGEKIDVLQGRILGINYGVKILPDNLKAVGVQLGDAFYILDYDEKTASYKTSFVVPDEPGEYSLDVLFMNFNDEVFFRKKMTLRVLPRGKVFAMQNEKLFSGNLSLKKIICSLENLFGGENKSCMTMRYIGSAEMKILWKNQDGMWEIWNAKKFNQDNPLSTNDKGEFGLSLANGEYEIDVTKNGFQERYLAVSVSNSTLNSDIQIYVKKPSLYVILIVVVLSIFIGKIMWKKIKKNMTET